LTEIFNLVAALFWVFLITALIGLWLYGGPEGRRIGLFSAIAAITTFLANSSLGFVSAMPLVLLIDTSLFFAAVCIALATEVHWPLWFAGFHMIGMASHTAGMLSEGELSGFYTNTAGIWALPALGSALVGAILDRRAGCITRG
jgi:hypothetical protein